MGTGVGMTEGVELLTVMLKTRSYIEFFGLF